LLKGRGSLPPYQSRDGSLSYKGYKAKPPIGFLTLEFQLFVKGLVWGFIFGKIYVKLEKEWLN